MARWTLSVGRFPCFIFDVTIFLGCGFAAKYREGGGNFSVPLQWMLGLRRLKLDAIWLELLPATDDPRTDQVRDREFPANNCGHMDWLVDIVCFIRSRPMTRMIWPLCDCIGISKRELLDRLGRTECSAQSGLFHSSAAATEI